MGSIPSIQIPQINYLAYAQAYDQKRRADEKQGWEREDRNYLSQIRARDSREHTEDRDYLRKKRGWEGEDRARAAKQFAFKNEMDALDYIKEIAPFINFGNYGKIREHLIEREVNPQLMPEPEFFSQQPDPEKAFDAWKSEALFEIDRYKAETARTTAENKQAEAPKTRSFQSGRTKITQEYDPTTKTWKEIGRGPMDKDPTGMEITTSDGTVIRTGVPHGSEATRTVKSDVQKKIIEANETYSDLKATLNKFDPKYLLGREKIGYFTSAFKEKWEIGDVSAEDRKELREYTSFKRDSIATLNNYIKNITGAAMSNEEAKRLMKGMPNPGVGYFDGDSPTEFKAKLDGVMETLDRVIARNNYVNKHGLRSFKEIGLDQMDGIIDQRGEELEAQIRQANPGMSEKEIEDTTLDELSKEFGVRF